MKLFLRALLGLGLFVAAVPCAQCEEPVPKDPPPRWWKGNLHTHSLWSDGNDFPEMIAEWYRTHGYHFLSLTDHNTLSAGRRWIGQAELEKRSGKEGFAKYLARYGETWIETRGDRDAGTFEVRLKPLDEFRSLVEERGRFLLIPGEEISDNDKNFRGPVHVNIFNLQEALPPTGLHVVREAIEGNHRAADEQAQRTDRELLVQLNHPNFLWAIAAEDMAAVTALKFFEVYNGHPNVHNRGDKLRAGVEEIWDIANSLRISEFRLPPIFATATDDSHHYHNFGDTRCRPGRGWIMVRARHLTTESLLHAMQQGDYYASTGVALSEVQFDADSKRLRLEIERDENATYTTRFIGTRQGYSTERQPRLNADGKPINSTGRYSADIGVTLATVEGLHPEYQLQGDELFVRAVITSSLPAELSAIEGEQQQAWTQPVGWQPQLKPR